MRRLKIAVIATVAWSVAVSAAHGGAPTPDIRFYRALERHDIYAAMTEFRALIESRLPAKPGRPDPLLDRAYVDLFAASGSLPIATYILPRIVADGTTPRRDHFMLLAANNAEMAGDFDAAMKIYERLSADSRTDIQTRSDAALGVARMQMAIDPGKALTTLNNIDRLKITPGRLWALDLLSSRAAAMTASADPTVSGTALDRAWTEVPQAELADAAAAHVAGDRIVAAGRAGDRKALASAFTVDRFDRGANRGQDGLLANLPLCGTGGLTPQDRVVIDVAHAPAPGWPKVTLIWASRPGIAQSFLSAAAKSGTIEVVSGQSATFSMACRSIPAPDYTVRNDLAETTLAWLTSQGAYSMRTQDEAADPAAIATRLAQREARYGAASIMLLPILLDNTMAGTMVSDPQTAKRNLANVSRIESILIAQHASADLLLAWRLQVLGFSMWAQTKTVAEATSEIKAAAVKAAFDPAISIDLLYTVASELSSQPNAPREVQKAILEATLGVLQKKAGNADPRVSAIAMRLIALYQAMGDVDTAASLRQALGFALDLCPLINPAPHFASAEIRSEDYPGDLIFLGIPGMMKLEFDLDATGAAQNVRTILSDPAYAFDDITKERARTIRYEPPRTSGPSGCHATMQSVRWQMPYGGYD